MTDAQFEGYMNFFKAELAKPITQEDARRVFYEMGYTNEQGEFNPEYKDLEMALALDLGKDRY